MIEQQIYIKTGIGLETSGKSTALTEEYIDTAIRPFYSSLDLFYLEGAFSPGYKSVIPLSNGLTLIGTGIKLDKNPFSFIHNFLVPEEDIRAFVKDSANLLAFPDKNASDTPYLPSLKEIPGTASARSALQKSFTALNISHAEYIALLAAAFSAVEQNRNLFIALPRQISMEEICAVMYGIYEGIPYYLRQKTGFSTLFGETEIRSEIKIYFIPDDKVIVGKSDFFIESYNASKDYIINLSKKSLSHIPPMKEELSGEYLSYASELKERNASLSDFFDFASEAERDFPEDRILSLRFYNDLSYIYNLKDNEETLPQRLGRIAIIFAELLRSGGKPRILESFSEFIRLYRRYLKQKNSVIPPEILKRLVLTYDACPEKQKNELYDLITLDIDACLKASGNEILFMHIDAAKGSAELYNKIIEHKMAPSNRFIKRYFTYLIEQRKTVHSLMEFADGIFSEMPQIADNDLISSMICDRARELYDTSGDRFEAVKYLEEKCIYLSERHPENAGLFSEIYHYALENFMSGLDISELNMAKIEKFPLTDGESINRECTVKHKIALAAKEVMALTGDMAMSFIHFDAFGFENLRENLADSETDGKNEEEALKSLLLRCLKEKKDAPKRIIYILLFYIYSSKESRIRVDFDSIFDFLDKELSVPPFEFTEWYLKSSLYITPITKNGRIIREAPALRADLTLLTAFYEALRKYFIKHNELLANSRNAKKLKKELDSVSLAHPDYRDLTQEFRKVLSGIVNEHHSPLKRMLNKIVSAKNFKFIVLLSCIVLIVLGGFAIGGLFTAKNDSETVSTLNSSLGEKTLINKTGWFSYKVNNDGTYTPSPATIDETDKSETINCNDCECIIVGFTSGKGLVIDGISIAATLSDENVSMEVYVYDTNGKKRAVSVSDYDILTGAFLYTFAEPISVKEISIAPNSPDKKGAVTVKEVNAYIIK